MKYLSKRLVNLYMFLACVGMMGYALYAQHVQHLEPCPLCVLQRFAVIALGVIFLVAFLFVAKKTLRWVYGIAFLIIGGAGVTVAGRHIWLQNLPPDEVPECGPGYDFIMDRFPLSEAMGMIFKGSGECAEIDWIFLGLTMPAWVLIVIVGLTIVGVINNFRKTGG